jgi:hypothetical protein
MCHHGIFHLTQLEIHIYLTSHVTSHQSTLTMSMTTIDITTDKGISHLLPNKMMVKKMDKTMMDGSLTRWTQLQISLIDTGPKLVCTRRVLELALRWHIGIC